MPTAALASLCPCGKTSANGPRRARSRITTNRPGSLATADGAAIAASSKVLTVASLTSPCCNTRMLRRPKMKPRSDWAGVFIGVSSGMGWLRASPFLGKHQLGGRLLRIPSARGFTVNGGDFLDGELTAQSFSALDLHCGGAAGLLIDFLIRRRFVPDIQLGRGAGFEEQDFGFGRHTLVFLVQDKTAEGEALQIGGLAVGISQRKHARAVGHRAVN